MKSKWYGLETVFNLKLNDWPSWIEITGLVKYSNITIRNIHSTYLIVETVDRWILYTFIKYNIEYHLKPYYELIET